MLTKSIYKKMVSVLYSCQGGIPSFFRIPKSKNKKDFYRFFKKSLDITNHLCYTLVNVYLDERKKLNILYLMEEDPMKKFLALCLAAMMALASASLIAADDGIMLISEAPAVAEEVVVTGVKAPATTPLFGLLRTVKVNVEATEGGKVSVPSKFVAALTSTRAFTVTPDESYEVADIIVNGVSYGPAYKVVLKNIAVNTDVKVVFQQKLVEVFTPVYAETFDGETKWVAGGHMESAAAADGVLNAVSVGGDPNINYPEAFGLNCDDIDAIRIKFTNNTDNTAFQIFFTNEANPGYSEAGSFKATSVIGENELVIYTAGNDLWTGTLSNMRIDLSNGAGSFVVDSISFDTVTMEVVK